LVKVEIWSDVVCPWCYIGKRHFEDALARFGHADQVEVEWRSFELDPQSPAHVDMPMSRILERKYGMTREQAEAANDRMTDLAAGVGLEYHLDEVQVGNTFDAHRLIHLASAHGLGDTMKERLLAAYFTEGTSPSDHDTLTGLAVEVGLDRGEVAATLAGDGFATEVRRDEARAASLGVSGVPFFVIDEAYGVSGAQPAEVLLGALERAWSESHPVSVVGTTGAAIAGGDEACEGGTCAV
jgi:predicted DsbA family dithiol-disulfide isomerase